MNLEETLKLLSALHHSGATHFKSADFEVTLKAGAPLEQNISPVSATGMAEAQSPPVAPNLSPEVIKANEEATEKLKNLIETMKLDDNQLMNKIFPAGAE